MRNGFRCGRVWGRCASRAPFQPLAMTHHPLIAKLEADVSVLELLTASMKAQLQVLRLTGLRPPEPADLPNGHPYKTAAPTAAIRAVPVTAKREGDDG